MPPTVPINFQNAGSAGLWSPCQILLKYSNEIINQEIKKKRSGAAVLISTVAARIGVANHEAIAAAKGAVEGLVRSASATYAAPKAFVLTVSLLD